MFHITTSESLRQSKPSYRISFRARAMHLKPVLVAPLYSSPQPQLWLLEAGNLQVLCRRHSGHGAEGQLQHIPPCSASMTPAPFLFQVVRCHESLVGTDYTTLWAHPSAQCFPSMPRTGSCNMDRYRKDVSIFISLSGAPQGPTSPKDGISRKG